MTLEPDWLDRDDDRAREFAATLCGVAAPDAALARLRAELDGISLVGERVLAPNAVEAIVETTAAAAWALLQRLRASLDRVDVFLQPLAGRGKKLLICDMDMTIVAAETLDEVAAELGLGDRIAAITERAMHGEIDFNDALRERIAMLAGQSEQVFHQVASELAFNPGAGELIAAANEAGLRTILISGGFRQVAEPVASVLGFDEVICNRLEIEQGSLTGRVREPIVNAEIKRATLESRARDLGIDLAACCAIGDGANDLPMLAAAGLGIAYRGKPVLRAATGCHIDHSDLSSAIYFMGLV